jgi:hypothetical protein
MIDVHCNRNWMVTKSDLWGFLKITILKKTFCCGYYKVIFNNNCERLRQKIRLCKVI